MYVNVCCHVFKQSFTGGASKRRRKRTNGTKCMRSIHQAAAGLLHPARASAARWRATEHSLGCCDGGRRQGRRVSGAPSSSKRRASATLRPRRALRATNTCREGAFASASQATQTSSAGKARGEKVTAGRCPSATTRWQGRTRRGALQRARGGGRRSQQDERVAGCAGSRLDRSMP